MDMGKFHAASVGHLHIFQAHVGTDFAVFPDLRRPLQPGVGVDHGIRRNFYTLFNESGMIISLSAVITPPTFLPMARSLASTSVR